MTKPFLSCATYLKKLKTRKETEMFFDKQYNLRKGPDGRLHSLDPREEESLQRQYARVSSMTEEEDRNLIITMARSNPRIAGILHEQSLQRQEQK